MARFNNILRFLLLHINFFFSTMGIAAMGIGIYILSAKWGSLDRGFFVSCGIILLLLGTTTFTVSIVGCFGATYQQRHEGNWTGRRVLGVYEITVFASLAAVLYLLCIAVVTSKDLGLALTALKASPKNPPPYLMLESIVAQKFNDFFFGAVSLCSDLKYTWFWTFVNQKCSAVINQGNCQKCHDFSITMCYADQQTCLSEGMTSTACPYQSCREGLIEYLVASVSPFAQFMKALAAFQIVIVIINCMLICYTERDSLEKQLLKSGTISFPTRKAAVSRDVERQSSGGPSRV